MHTQLRIVGLGTAREIALDVFVMLCRDKSWAVVKAALIGGQGLAASHPHIVVPLVTEIFDGVGLDPLAVEVRKVCLGLSLALDFKTDEPYGGSIVWRVLSDINANEVLAVELIFLASGYVLEGPLDPPNARSDLIRLRSIQLLTTIASRLASESRALDSLRKGGSAISVEDLARVKVLGRLAYRVGIHLQHVLRTIDGDQKGKDGRGQVTAGMISARFLRECVPLLDTLLTISFPEVVHAVLETLQHLVQFAPGPVLMRIRTAVRSGQEGAYQFEPLGVGLIVRLIRRYLADHRRLLQEEKVSREAIVEILDVFVGACWPEALELTFRLDEVFR